MATPQTTPAPKPVRARALDPTKALAIFRADEDKDIVNDTSALPRMVANIPTGMEKGEEEVRPFTYAVHSFVLTLHQEHHIQAALSSQQGSGSLEMTTNIPV